MVSIQPVGGSTHLHIHQGAVLRGPGLLQDLKDGHSAAIHDVNLALTDVEASQTELGCQQLLLGPLGVVVGIVLGENDMTGAFISTFTPPQLE